MTEKVDFFDTDSTDMAYVDYSTKISDLQPCLTNIASRDCCSEKSTFF